MSQELLLCELCGECGTPCTPCRFDSFFTQVAYLCQGCGNGWTRPLTPEERWAVLHGH